MTDDDSTRTGVCESTRVLAINGSERADGSTGACLVRTSTYLRELGAELDIVHLTEQTIHPCRCGRCNSRPDPCPVDDDTGAIVARMKAAEAIIYAAPVHGFGLSSVMQLFIERAGVGHLRFDRPLTNRIGGVIVVGRRYSHHAVHAQLVNNLLLNRMILPGSGFPALIQASGPQGVDSDPEGLDAMYRMLDRVVEMCATMRGSTNPMPGPPTVELRTGALS